MDTPYNCESGLPTILSTANSKFSYKLPYADYFGGVTSFPLQTYLKINGMANTFWGWGGEDDDLAYRIAANGLNRTKVNATIGRYNALPHKQEKANPERYKIMGQLKNASQKEGLNQVVYKVKRITQSPMYTHLYVDLLRELDKKG